jgi:hypothetical protein
MASSNQQLQEFYFLSLGMLSSYQCTLILLLFLYKFHTEIPNHRICVPENTAVCKITDALWEIWISVNTQSKNFTVKPNGMTALANNFYFLFFFKLKSKTIIRVVINTVHGH